MNIYAARKLQKALYKRAETDYKYMLCTMMAGELFYHNITRISNQDFRIITEGFINALLQSAVIDDVKTIIFYRDVNNIQGWPIGMYLAEIIKID
jgi:hypothetical protein